MTTPLPMDDHEEPTAPVSAPEAGITPEPGYDGDLHPDLDGVDLAGGAEQFSTRGLAQGSQIYRYLLGRR